jgi:purine-binding chemotaxis protein CheW
MTSHPSGYREPRQTIDWEQIHRRLTAVRNAIEVAAAPPPAILKKILKERAIALAREAKMETAGSAIDVLEFDLAYERYGFELAYIREVCPLAELTPLPGTPDFVLGIVNVRGRIVSVIDIRKFFDLPDKGLSDLNKVVILTSDTREFGVLTDRIVCTRSLLTATLQESLPTLTDVRSQYLKGVTGERLIVLDAGKILRDEKLVVNVQPEQ